MFLLNSVQKKVFLIIWTLRFQLLILVAFLRILKVQKSQLWAVRTAVHSVHHDTLVCRTLGFYCWPWNKM